MKQITFLFVFLTTIIVLTSCDKIFPTKEPEPVKPPEPTLTLGLNGTTQNATFSGVNLVYQVNPDAPGSYKISLEAAISLGSASNLFFSIWCFDIHNPIAGGMRPKKYFMNSSRVDCRDYNGVQLCDGANLHFNINDNAFVTDTADFNNYIHITVCDAKQKKISGNASVKTFATNDQTNIQIVTMTFANIPYIVLN